MTKNRKSTDVNSRRGFLKGGAVAAAAGAATLAMPNVARAQDAVTFKFQSTWPAKDIFHEFAATSWPGSTRWAAEESSSTFWRRAPSPRRFEVQDAVLAGTLDGGHGVTAYWYGKHKALSLFGTPPAWGWRANQMLGWVKYGGGQALYDELVQQVLGLDLVGFLTGPMPTQPLGWFKQEITDAASSRASNIAPSASRPTCSRRWARRSPSWAAARSCRPWTAACSMRRSSTTHRPTSSWASRTCRRTTCCKAITSRPNASRSSSTRRSSMRWRPSCRRSSNMRRKPPQPT